MPINTGDNKFGVAKWIVDATGGGTHTTLTSALADAVSGDTIFIRPGTYTESPNLKAGVSLTAFQCNAPQRNVTLVGALALSSGTCCISGINLQTNTSNLLRVTGSAAANVVLSNCYLTVSAASQFAISFTNSNAASSIEVRNCSGNLSGSCTALYSSTSPGQIIINNSQFSNTASSTVASTQSVGSVSFDNVSGPIIFAVTSSGNVTVSNCYFTTVSNTTQFAMSGTSTALINQSYMEGGTSSAITVGSGCTLRIYESTLKSTNTNAVSGSGTIYSGPLSYADTGIGNSVSTVFDMSFGRKGTWTPVLTFGGGSTGITFSSLGGTYWVIGKMVFFYLFMKLTNKGSSTGTAAISLPFASVSEQNTAIDAHDLVSNPQGTNYYVGTIQVGSTIQILNVNPVGSTTFLSNSNFGNATWISTSGFYWTV